MNIEVNPQVIERGRRMAESMIYDYETDSPRLAVGTPQVLDLFLIKADELQQRCTDSFDDGRTGVASAPAHVRLDYANEFVAWITVSVELLAHFHASEQPCIEVLRRGYVPPLRFTEAEQHLFNSYQKMLKLMVCFVEAMPLKSFLSNEEFSPFVEDQICVAETSLRLAGQVCDLALSLMEAIRPGGALPSRALWISKRIAVERKVEALLFDQQQCLTDSRGEWHLQQVFVEMPDGTTAESWQFKPAERPAGHLT